MDNRLSYKQFLKFSIIDAIMNNDDTDLEDLILKLLVECNNTQSERREEQDDPNLRGTA
jgi:hypothetical protein